MKPADPIASAHPARMILILALAHAVGLGIGRFGYSLVLPDMRDALGWSYSTAGFMNTVNAIGYLAGALGASAFVRRFGLYRSVMIGAVACLISLAICALPAGVTVFGFARVLSGLGAALIVVGGGALAATIAQSSRSRSAYLISLFYTGPAVGLIVSGVMSPFLLQVFGPGSWWIVWIALTALSALMLIPFLLNPVHVPVSEASESAAPVALKPIMTYLAGYFLFGAGYIAYMTFLIAYVRDHGGNASAQSLVWCMIGCAGCIAPWLWRSLMARRNGGITTAILIGVATTGTVIALIGTSTPALAVSAFVFGSAFFSVTTATTAFARLNYPPAAWPKAIGLITIMFSLGQSLGPFATGAITDATGSLTYALYLSAGASILGCVLCALQRPLKSPTT
ncbi:YbfB/YjiJ family MFS transporter [soil metagenome]